MKAASLTEEQINKLLAYLGTKPFVEVEGLVNMLREEWVKQNTPTPPEPTKE